MKKFTAAIVTVLMILPLVFTASADVGMPMPEGEKFCTGPDGFDYMTYDSDEVIHLDVEMGTVIGVIGKFDDDEWMVEFSEDGISPVTEGRITDAQYDALYPKDEAVSPELGAPLTEAVTTETSFSSCMLRYGPGRGFDKSASIKQGEKVTYRYVYDYWCYAEAEDGRSGWVEVNLLNKVVMPETEPATEPVTEPATEPVTEPATEPATEPETEPATEPETEPATEPETETETEAPAKKGSSGKSSDVMEKVLICVAAALIVAAVAAVIIIIIAKSRKDGKKKDGTDVK